jgi:hypothetical protein
MVHLLGDQATQVADLVREMAADPAHPLFDTIGRRTLYDWNADPDSWAKFQQLAWVNVPLSGHRPAPPRSPSWEALIARLC